MGDTYHEAHMLAQEEAEAFAKADKAAGETRSHPVPFNLIVTPGELSDLFFNHEHQNRKALYDTFKEDSPVSKADFRRSERACLEADAHEFLDCMPNAVDREARATLVPWLVRDFLARV